MRRVAVKEYRKEPVYLMISMAPPSAPGFQHPGLLLRERSKPLSRLRKLLFVASTVIVLLLPLNTILSDIHFLFMWLSRLCVCQFVGDVE